MATSQELRASLRAWMTKKKEIETELMELEADLSTTVGLRGGLIDREGFPRADIDVPKIRFQRHRVACLQTDLREVMSAIEHGLEELHSVLKQEAAGAAGSDGSGGDRDARERGAAGSALAAPTITDATPSQRGPAVGAETAAADAAAAAPAPAPGPTSGPPVQVPPVPETNIAPPAFALVDQVSEGSPAEQCGLQVGDRVVKFGAVHAGNHRGLQAVAEELRAGVGVGIAVQVMRAGSLISLSLMPRVWSGRGLLGCHLAPL